VARKRLIKGANAARVEERIARVPADVEGPGNGAGESIFGALRALEKSEASAAKPAARKPATRTLPAREAEAPKPAAPRPAGRKGPPASAPLPAAEKPAKAQRLGPSDFNAAEREAIVRCCSDYRNHLPSYLLAVQKEVRVIDSVIDKCRAASSRTKKP
jgi:hypothetical protein